MVSGSHADFAELMDNTEADLRKIKATDMTTARPRESKTKNRPQNATRQQGEGKHMER